MTCPSLLLRLCRTFRPQRLPCGEKSGASAAVYTWNCGVYVLIQSFNCFLRAVSLCLLQTSRRITVSRSSRGRHFGPSLQISLVAQAEHAAPILPAHGSEFILRAMHCESRRYFGLNGPIPMSLFMFVQKKGNCLARREPTLRKAEVGMSPRR